MKIKKYLLFVVVVTFILFLFGLNNRIYAMTENDDFNEIILSDAEIIESLSNLLQKYMNAYELEDETCHDETCQKIHTLSNYISFKKQGMNKSSEENDEYSELNRYGLFNISPNCTCNELNYLTDTPCANCQYYWSVLEEVYAVIAGFNIRGWALASDLLTHNLNNDTLDSDYYPSADLVSVISDSSQIDGIRYNDELYGDFGQENPGWANGIFASTVDGDVYNSLGGFRYIKNYSSNGYVRIGILDRYDWEFMDGSSLAAMLNNNMVEAQELGILTPFYTCIEIITEGFSPFSWDYQLNGVVINEYYGSNSTPILPSQIYDLRYYQQNMIYANVTSIADSAFQYCTNLESITFENNSTLSNIGSNAFYGCTSLESITIPSTVTNIGAYAFYGCTSLEEVEILKVQSPITNLGLNAFDNCSSNLTITVPTNRLCEYKNTPFWSSYRNKIVPSSPIVDDIDLDCMTDSGVTTYLNAGYNKLYRLDVECDGWYTISISNDAHFNIYNSNMVKIDESYDTYELTLNEGTYYIDVEWNDEEDYGNVTLHFFNKGINVSSIVTNNILPHLHQVDVNDYRVQLKYYNNQGPGFYNIIVNATSINPITYYEGT
ncbi:MAG: leucine-rich repeat domain-containing protein, partial [Bacilli bacterium]|nr:leucine-rich repeat domain-containing protein [Bacilli bacterium]